MSVVNLSELYLTSLVYQGHFDVSEPKLSYLYAIYIILLNYKFAHFVKCQMSKKVTFMFISKLFFLVF